MNAKRKNDIETVHHNKGPINQDFDFFDGGLKETLVALNELHICGRPVITHQ